MLFCIFLLLLTEIECFLCMFAGNLREFIYMGISDEKLWESCLKGDKPSVSFIADFTHCCAIMESSYFPTRTWWKIAYRIFLSI